MDDRSHPILLFDGVCNFCDASVQFIIKRDPQKQFRFAALQSQTGRKLLEKFGLPVSELNTMFVIDGEKYYAKSDAALFIAKRLSGFWSWLSVGAMIPQGVRDTLYDFVAKNRYRWFGKKTNCPIPGSDIRERFLE